MKLNKIIFSTLAAAAALSASAAYADTNDDYIKTFGMVMFERNGLADLQFTPAEFDVFISGLKEYYNTKKLPENIQEKWPQMIQYLTARAEANMAKEAEKTAAAAADFWKNLEKNEKLNKTPTGLAYEIIEKGNGATPTENSDVVIIYTGKLIDGTVFDASNKHGGPASLNLAKVIPGFREGLQKFAKGGKGRLYIPANLGYGAKAIPGIPGNSTLIFDIEIVDVDPKGTPVPAEAAQPAPQPAQPAKPAAK